MIEIKRLSECTFHQATEAWNRGFSGYEFDLTLSVDDFTARFGRDYLSASCSVVAFVNGEPAGIVVNGIRTISGKKVAWNGGTGVAPEYRGHGLGKKLMEAALAIYRQEGVELATLEVLTHNRGAVALYERMGFQITAPLLTLSHDGTLAADAFSARKTPYLIRPGLAKAVQSLPFYEADVPYQLQWQNIPDGESVLVLDEQWEIVGYALFTRQIGEPGKKDFIRLCQCVARTGRTDQKMIIRAALHAVFAPHDLPCVRAVGDLPARHTEVIAVLQEADFTVVSNRHLMTWEAI